MGNVVQFAARMKSVAQIAAETMGVYGELAIQLRPVAPKAAEALGLPAGTAWAWAIVQFRPGQPDALLFGGTSDSQSGAEAQAREEFKRQEFRWAQQRAERKCA